MKKRYSKEQTIVIPPFLTGVCVEPKLPLATIGVERRRLPCSVFRCYSSKATGWREAEHGPRNGTGAYPATRAGRAD